MKATKQEQRLARLETSNAIIRVIASHGRRFFSEDADRQIRKENPRISHFELGSRCRLWYIDKLRGARIYVHHDPRWRSGWGWRFSDGGTLLDLCQHLRDYILDRRDEIDMRLFGPWPEWVCGGDLWAYGTAMEAVRTEIRALLQGTAGRKAGNTHDAGSTSKFVNAVEQRIGRKQA